MDRVLAIDVGRKNLALCVVQPGEDAHGQQDVICHWTVIAVEPSARGIAQALVDLGIEEWLRGVKDVVIERQPGRNCCMVKLQCFLEMFFTLSGCMVSLQDSRLKLNFAAATRFWPGTIPDNWTHYTRKKVAVQTVASYLDQVPQSNEIRAIFERNSKKDDLADSLLHALAYAHFNRTPFNPSSTPKLPAPRRPSARQLASGKLAKSHVLHLAAPHASTIDSLHAACAASKPLAKGIARHFGSVEACHRLLNVGDLGPSPRTSSAVPFDGPDTQRHEEACVPLES